MDIDNPTVYVYEDYYYGAESYGISHYWIELSAKTIQDFTEAELRFLRGVQIHLQSGCKEMDLRAKLRLISEIIFNYILLREKMVNID